MKFIFKNLDNIDDLIAFLTSPIGIPVTLMVLGMIGFIVFSRILGKWRIERESERWEKEYFSDIFKDEDKTKK